MFLFSLKSALLLVLLYVPYVLLLHREAFFRFNRAVLLAIMVLALTLPLVNVAPLSFDDVAAVSSVQTRLIDLGVPIEAAPAEAAAPALPQRETASFWLLFTWVYALVAAGLLVSRLWGFVRLRRIVRHSTIEHLHRDGLHIYIHAGEAAPFSWGRSIVVGQKDYEAHGREILLHETGHIRLHHSADVVLLTLCEMLQWFNPLVWMMGRSLTDLHEYEADAYVVRHDVDARTYQRLLLQRVAGRSGLTLVQSFAGSLTRRRILMMHAARSAEAARWRRLRVLYVLPVLLLAAGIFATKEFREISAAVVEHDPTLVALSSLATVQDDEAADESAGVVQPVSPPDDAAPALAPSAGTTAAPVDGVPASLVAPTTAALPLEDTLPTISSAEISLTKVHIAQAEALHGLTVALPPPSVEVVASAESERMMDVGYGTMQKKLVSSHVNGYTGEELVKTGGRTLCEALARKVPGLSYVGGEMVYRAERVGLFFVDGVQTSSPNDVNLHDIDYVEFDAEAFIYGSLDTLATIDDRVAAVYTLLTSRVKWDGDYALYSSKRPAAVLKDGTGSSADVNFVLIGMLREAGIEAWPVLVRMRHHGHLPVTHPSLKKMDTFVVAFRRGDDDWGFVDATSTTGHVDVLRLQLMTDRGLIVAKGGIGWVDLSEKCTGREVVRIDAEVRPDGTVVGERPAKMTEDYAVSLTIPEGYDVEELPKSLSVKTPDGSIACRVMFARDGNVINVTYRYQLIRLFFGTDEYADLREVYNLIYAKCNEMIAIRKR